MLKALRFHSPEDNTTARKRCF